VCSQNRCLCGRHCCAHIDGRRPKLFRIDSHGIASDRLRARKRALRNCCHRTLNISVHIINIRDRGVLVDNRCVVEIRDRCGVDVSVCNIHPGHVHLADPIGRDVDFARAEWEPSDIAGRQAATHESDECRSIDGPILARTGNPAPPSIDRGPPSIVEWRVSPGIIVNPSPSPRIDPRPASFMVWRPTSIYARIPDVSVC
jgi:hypothetical protein